MVLNPNVGGGLCLTADTAHAGGTNLGPPLRTLGRRLDLLTASKLLQPHAWEVQVPTQTFQGASMPLSTWPSPGAS